MKIAGIVLIILQIVSFIPSLIAGDPIFGNGNIAWIFGRFIFGIVGVILLIIDYRRKNKNGGE